MAIIFPRETPGLTSPNAVLETTKSVAPIDAGSCEVNNEVTKLVGEQLQKQFDFFEQSSAASGIDYKFTARIEMLDGGNGADAANVLETYEIAGAYLDNVQYGTLAYATSDPVQITMSIRYDNAIQTPRGTGIGSDVARTLGTAVTGGGL